jgi:hypothetical protein
MGTHNVCSMCCMLRALCASACVHCSIYFSACARACSLLRFGIVTQFTAFLYGRFSAASSPRNSWRSVASARFELVCIDVLRGYRSLSVSLRGNTCGFVTANRSSRYCVTVPTSNQLTVTIADAVFRHRIMRCKCPMRMYTDQGVNFEGILFGGLSIRCQTTKARAVANHPQSKGSVERMSRTSTHILQTAPVNQVDYHLQRDYSTSPSRTTERSPFSPLYREEACAV